MQVTWEMHPAIQYLRQIKNINNIVDGSANRRLTNSHMDIVCYKILIASGSEEAQCSKNL